MDFLAPFYEMDSLFCWEEMGVVGRAQSLAEKEEGEREGREVRKPNQGSERIIVPALTGVLV